MQSVDRPRTPSEWTSVAHTFTRVLNESNLTTRTDCLVRIVDGEGAESLPIAWHIPATSDIVLNAKLIKEFQRLKSISKDELDKMANSAFGAGGYHRAAAHWEYERAGDALSEDGRFSGDDDYLNLAAMLIARGVIAHEAAHSKWSHYITESWYSEISDQQREVISQLDEVRIEAMQKDEYDDVLDALRLSAGMLLPTRDDIDKMLTADRSRLNIPAFALNSVLTLGRWDMGIFLEYEIAELRTIVEDVVGFERVQSMRKIWSEFAEISPGEEQEKMTALADEWIELFRDENETMDLAGLAAMIGELLAKIAADTEKWSTNRDQDRAPSDMMDPTEAAKVVFPPPKDKDGSETDGEKKDDDGDPDYSGGGRGRGSISRRKPRPEEKTAAAAMARELEKLSLHAKTEITKRSLIPPGRLQSRAAVTAAADKAEGRATAAKPWERKLRKYAETNKLTVGVMTDVSGSMGWAEDFVASASWIIAKSVMHVNGSVATVAFGDQAVPIIPPTGADLSKVVMHEADGGSEAFNEGAAALDGVLRLSDASNGIRVLFAITDGMLVGTGEMEAAEAWVRKLTKSGCTVIWVTPLNAKAELCTRKCCPPGAVHTLVDKKAPLAELSQVMTAAVVKELKKRH